MVLSGLKVILVGRSRKRPKGREKMVNLKHECGFDKVEKDECDFIDAVLAIYPAADIEHVTDLMTGGCTPKEAAKELKSIDGVA